MHHESISLTILEHSKLVWSEQLFTMHRICVLVALCLYAAYGYESCDQKIMEDTICSLCGQRKGSEQHEAGIDCKFQSTILCRSIFRKRLFFLHLYKCIIFLFFYLKSVGSLLYSPFFGYCDKLIYLDFSNWIFGLADINLKYLHYHYVYSIKLITTYI